MLFLVEVIGLGPGDAVAMRGWVISGHELRANSMAERV